MRKHNVSWRMIPSWPERWAAMRTLAFGVVLASVVTPGCQESEGDVEAARYAATPPVPPLEDTQPAGLGIQPIGGLDVTHDGAATYIVPLRLLDGRNGLEPQLALTYHSRAGNGVAGVGWSLSGLSAISRCPRAPRHGGGRAVMFDAEDRICLDGRYLLHVGGGSPGLNGAVYRPQREGYERVVLHGELHKRDAWFEVTHSDGTTYEYGHADGASIGGLRYEAALDGTPADEGQHGTLSWLLNRITDTSGNFITFGYIDRQDVDPSDPKRVGHEVLVDEIRYTGHPTLGPGRRTVQFVYEDRPDTSEGYIGGLRLVSSQRLARLRMHRDGDVRDTYEYAFAYEPSVRTHRSLLRSLALCDGLECMPPTRFSYTEEGATAPVAFDEEVLFDTPYGWYPDVFAAGAWDQTFLLSDLDGNGQDDLLYFAADQLNPITGLYSYHARLNRGEPQPAGIPQVLASAFGPADLAPLLAADLDNDGRAEVYRRSIASTGGLRVQQWEWLASSLALLDADYMRCASRDYGLPLLLGDVDANGSADIVGACAVPPDTMQWFVRLQDGVSHGGFLEPQSLRDGTYSTESSVLLAASDGRLGVLFREATPTFQLATWREGSAVVEDTNLELEQKLVFLDVNGDGLRDVLDLHEDGHENWRVRLNTGRGFAQARPMIDARGGIAVPEEAHRGRRPNDVRVMDLNADGLEDFLVFYGGVDTKAGVVPHYSTGRGYQPGALRSGTSDPFGIPWEPFVAARSSRDPVQAVNWGGAVQIGDIDGDGQPDLVGSNRTSVTAWRSSSSTPDLLTAVEYGPASLFPVEVRYHTIRSGEIVEGRMLYRAPQAVHCYYPQACVYRGMTVVESVRRRTRAAALHPDVDSIFQAFEYAGGRVDTQGQGWLGFSRRSRVDWLTEPDPDPHVAWRRRDHSRTTWHYDLGDRATPDGSVLAPGAPSSVESVVLEPVDGVYHGTRAVVGRTARLAPLLGDGIFFARPFEEAEAVYELNELPPTLSAEEPLRLSVTTTYYDEDLALPKRVRRQTENGDLTILDQDWSNDLDQNLIGRPRLVTVTSFVEDLSDEVTQYFEDYYPGTFNPRRVVSSPSDPLFSVTTTIDRNPRGLVERIEHRTPDPRVPGREIIRESTLAYDEEEVYLARTTLPRAPVPLSERVVIHPSLGVVQRTIGPNGARTDYSYDRLGRLRAVLPATTARRVVVDYVSDRVDGDSVFDSLRLRTRGEDGSESWTFLDAFGRSRWERHRGPGVDEWFAQGVERDRFGNVERAVLPHRVGEAAPAIAFEHDLLSRTRRVTLPNGSEQRSDFEGLLVRTTSPGGAVSTHEYDVNGRLATASRAGLPSIQYRYGPFGRIRRVELPDGAGVWTFHHDPAGNLERVDDPSVAGREEIHNGLGEVYLLRNADGTETELRYDEIGRPAERIESDGRLTEWRWDRTSASLGRLHSTYSADGVETVFDYDSAGNRSLVRTTAAGQTVSSHYVYEQGHLRQLRIVPPAMSPTGDQILTYERNRGYLTSIHLDTAERTLWTADEYSPFGFPARDTLDNGITTTRDLESVTDNTLSVQSAVEDRVTSLDADGNVTQVVENLAGVVNDYEPDGYGRLSNWRVGGELRAHYSYADATGNLDSNELATSLTYEPTTRRLASVDGQPVTHDARGRITELPGLRVLQYNDLDLPRLTRADSGDETTTSYDAAGGRVLEQAAGRTRLFAGGLYRRAESGGSVTDEVRVPGPFGPLARIVGGSIEYLHHDHLGSTSVVTNQDGAVIDRPFFSPFGALVDGQGEPTQPAYDALEFAGHDYELAPGDGPPLLNMRGRVYSAHLGRFLTTDPVVSSPDAPGAWNRYAYTGNNPTTFVDPTGFVPFYAGSGGGGAPSTPWWDPSGAFGAGSFAGPTLAGDLFGHGFVGPTVNAAGVGQWIGGIRAQVEHQVGAVRDASTSALSSVRLPTLSEVLNARDLVSDFATFNAANLDVWTFNPAIGLYNFLSSDVRIDQPEALELLGRSSLSGEILRYTGWDTRFRVQRDGPIATMGTLYGIAGTTVVSAGLGGVATSLAGTTGGTAGAVAARGVSLNSSNLAMGVERASPELLAAVQGHGRTIQIVAEGSEELRYLNYIGAEANVGGETMSHILLQANPSKAAVLEEFLHGTQFRLGIVQRLGVQGAETHVKSFMIRHSRMLGLGEADVAALRQLMEAGL